jgi:murein DD-endopeptidase MepM/ murein hydrolase activator NlpD
LVGSSDHIHRGTDLAAADGTPIRSPLDGVVTSVSEDASDGISVVVRHGSGIETRYHHLGSAAVRPEQRLSQGDLLGTVGTSGKTTGPHVHFEVRDLGDPIDPRAFLH